MNYSILVCEINGKNCLMILDNDTGRYLTRWELENWVEYVGGVKQSSYE